MNELLLIISVPIIFGGVLLSYKLFGKSGLYCFTVIATLLANIEVLILVRAFGVIQTLGNVLFAATLLITDILSENEGKETAKKAVYLGIFANICMIALSSLWLLYTPENSDTFSAVKEIFSRTPRLLLASLTAFAVSQWLDVFLYHRIWRATEAKSGSKARFLWVRNNSAALISQIFNTVIFNFIAFYGVYSTSYLLSIMLSSYVIYAALSLLSTPFLYISKKIKKRVL